MAKQAQAVHDLTLKHNNIHFTRWRELQVALAQQPLPHLSQAIEALDNVEADLVAQQRQAAQPKTHRYELLRGVASCCWTPRPRSVRVQPDHSLTPGGIAKAPGLDDGPTHRKAIVKGGPWRCHPSIEYLRVNEHALRSRRRARLDGQAIAITSCGGRSGGDRRSAWPVRPRGRGQAAPSACCPDPCDGRRRRPGTSPLRRRTA